MIDCSGCWGACCIAAGCNLLVGGRCSVYEKRPTICRTDDMFDKYFSHEMSREEYDKKSAKACETLRMIYRERCTG